VLLLYVFDRNACKEQQQWGWDGPAVLSLLRPFLCCGFQQVPQKHNKNCTDAWVASIHQ